MKASSSRPRRVVLLGSTGSIGTSAVEIVRAHPYRFEVVALSACSRWQLALDQAAATGARFLILTDPEAAVKARSAANGTVEVLAGNGALDEVLAGEEVDVVLVGISGTAGLDASVSALQSGCTLALANKESLVMGGRLLMDLAVERGATILPVDSEHSAIFQALAAGEPREVKRIILTASGGPFRDVPGYLFPTLTVAQALAHPTWNMGVKITIDSACLLNKALEIVEARWLFDQPAEAIEVVIHPQSIVHSMVEFVDGSVIAQMGIPDMKVPIQYALGYPERLPCPVEPLDLARVGSLTFEEPDLERFPALAFGFEAARKGGTAGAVLAAAGERAVERFVAGEITFPRISEVIRDVMDRHEWTAEPDLDQIRAANRWARLTAGTA